jgi:hypothetical protein
MNSEKSRPGQMTRLAGRMTMKRRDFLKSGVAGAACAVTGGIPGLRPATFPGTRQAGAPTSLPTIRLGTLEVSRFILGSNPFWGYSHKSAELDEEMRRFHTDERIRGAGLPAGCAAHWPEIHPELERRKFPTDFYYQCFYNASKTSDYSAAEREKAVATVLRLDKPVIAYKILAAGRLSASEGFEYAFNHIRRKDGVCVGIYAQRAIDQIRQNATYTELLSTK